MCYYGELDYKLDVFQAYFDKHILVRDLNSSLKFIELENDFTQLKINFPEFVETYKKNTICDGISYYNDTTEGIPDYGAIEEFGWYELQQGIVAAIIYSNTISDRPIVDKDALKYFSFENRKEISLDIIKKYPIFENLALPEVRQKLILESLIKTQPPYEPGTYFTDTSDNGNELNAPKKKTFKI